MTASNGIRRFGVVAILLSVVATTTSTAMAQNYWWARGFPATITSRSRSIVGVQGATPLNGFDMDTTDSDTIVASSVTRSMSAIPEGGGGGNGGHAASMGDGLSGLDFSRLDGIDGEDAQGSGEYGEGGAGGRAGGDGTAIAYGQANGIVELNPNLQGVFQWSFNHGHTGTFDLKGAGGGGGGGGGGSDYHPRGGEGGSGGRGRDADGNSTTFEASDVVVDALLLAEVSVPPTQTTNAFITVDMGWSSNSTQFGNGGNIWRRQAALHIQLFPATPPGWEGPPQQGGFGNAEVFVGDAGPGQLMLAICRDGYGTITTVYSSAPENAVVGSLAVGAAETLVWTAAGATANMHGDAFDEVSWYAMRSTLNGAMTAYGGLGGGGGGGGGEGSTNEHGANGLDGDALPEGILGGAVNGGAGGAGGQGVPDIFESTNHGGNGGRGGHGGKIDGYAGGFYQGVASVWVEQLDPP